jgi:hypothetical protein
MEGRNIVNDFSAGSIILKERERQIMTIVDFLCETLRSSQEYNEKGFHFKHRTSGFLWKIKGIFLEVPSPLDNPGVNDGLFSLNVSVTCVSSGRVIFSNNPKNKVRLGPGDITSVYVDLSLLIEVLIGNDDFPEIKESFQPFLDVVAPK